MSGKQQKTVRDQKRAQFEQPKRGMSLHLVLAGVALVAVIAVAAFVMSNRGGAETATATARRRRRRADVTIPVAEVADGQAHFYSYDAGGTTVKYFVLTEPDGEVPRRPRRLRRLLPQKKGYQPGGRHHGVQQLRQQFDATQINVVTRRLQPHPARAHRGRADT